MMILSARTVPKWVTAAPGISSSTLVPSWMGRSLAMWARNFKGWNRAWPGNRTAPATGKGREVSRTSSAGKPSRFNTAASTANGSRWLRE